MADRILPVLWFGLILTTRAVAIVAVSLGVVGCSAPARPTLAATPDVDDYIARSRCVRQEINRMLADPKEADRGASDMATYAVGRCSQSVWNKIMHGSHSPHRIDERMQDELMAQQDALGMIIDARTKR